MTQIDKAADSIVHLRNAAGDEAAVSVHGAQLLSWQVAGAGEQIYTSPLAQPAPGKALRGGVPVCFPQFSERGSLPKHGFARTSRWELVTPQAAHARVAEATFQLDASMVPGQWEHAFCLVLVVRLGPKWLELELQAANTGRTPYDFTCALHTYLAVADVRQAQLEGLQGLEYEDMVDGGAVRVEPAAPLRFSDEIDRVYRGVAGPLLLSADGMPQRRVLQDGFVDAVVWNPGPAKAARLGDMPAEDWTRMLCIEAAAIAQPVQLAPGKTWHGVQRIELPRVSGFDAA
jgi:glucose-6-phosphate 1-epimerase